MGTLEDLISTAEKNLGLAGKPNVITREYASRNGSYFSTAAWCDQGVTYWARHSGNFTTVCHGTDYAYTVAHAQRFQSAGEWHAGTSGIKRGDIVFFNWDATTNTVASIDHVGIVTDVKGASVYTIEANTSNTVARRVRQSKDVVGYGRPKYAAEPASKPKSTAKKATYTPPKFPGVKPNHTSPSAKTLQSALKAAGYMPKSVVLADNYGSQTQAAVRRFHAANPQYASGPNDPAIGPKGWAALFRKAYG